MSCDLAMSTFQQETSHLSDAYHHQYNNMSQAESLGESSLQHPDGNSRRKVSHEMQKPDPPAAAAAPPPLRPLVKVLACFAAIGGFLFGYDTGVVSGAMILLKKEFGLNTIWQEMIVSVTIGAAALSALLGGIFNEKLGRRKVILIASTVFTAGALMMGLTPNKELLLAGRLVVGIGVGMNYD